MNSALAELKQRLGPLLGSRVTRMVLLVWPDEDNNIETDIRVNFTLERLDGKVVSYSFFIAADGQTPGVYCIPGMTKGTILTYLPVHWFPAPLESVSV